jgi:hypothetical protein
MSRILEDASYENLRRALVWNQLVPERHPRIIVEAASDNDVVEAVRFAETSLAALPKA